MTNYIVELRISDQFMVDAKDQDEASIFALEEASVRYDLMESDIEVMNIKEVN